MSTCSPETLKLNRPLPIPLLRQRGRLVRALQTARESRACARQPCDDRPPEDHRGKNTYRRVQSKPERDAYRNTENTGYPVANRSNSAAELVHLDFNGSQSPLDEF
jgi:hypothetical protein